MARLPCSTRITIFAIDVGDFQADSFRDAQPSRVADGQNRAMFEIPHTTENLQNFFGAGHNWKLLGFLGVEMTSVRLQSLCSVILYRKRSAATARMIELGASFLRWLSRPGRNEVSSGPSSSGERLKWRANRETCCTYVAGSAGRTFHLAFLCHTSSKRVMKAPCAAGALLQTAFQWPIPQAIPNIGPSMSSLCNRKLVSDQK